jgi:predicted nucleotidyltransferase
MEAGQIIVRLRRELPAILEPYPVVAAYVYGSVVADCLRPGSDVDVALVLRPDAALTAYERMRLDLEVATEIEARCGVREADVRGIQDAPLRVQGRVLTEGQLLYSGDEEARVAYEVRTRTRYFDFLPVLTMMREAYLARLAVREGKPADAR